MLNSVESYAVCNCMCACLCNCVKTSGFVKGMVPGRQSNSKKGSIKKLKA